MTNRKLHMHFRLAPRLMTLDDLNCYKFKFFFGILRYFTFSSEDVCCWWCEREERMTSALFLYSYCEGWFNELCRIYQGCCDYCFWVPYKYSATTTTTTTTTSVFSALEVCYENELDKFTLTSDIGCCTLTFALARLSCYIWTDWRLCKQKKQPLPLVLM